MSVLVVDDVAFQRQLLQKTLEQYGHEVFLASGHAEAIDILKQNPGIGAVLCDLMMPQADGINLLEACRQELKSGVPAFILMTAATDENYLSRAHSAGFVEIMKKPIETDYLMRRLAELLETRI